VRHVFVQGALGGTSAGHGNAQPATEQHVRSAAVAAVDSDPGSGLVSTKEAVAVLKIGQDK